jgi:hypothetical protein
MDFCFKSFAVRFKVLDFCFKVLDFVSKSFDFVSKFMDFCFKSFDFVSKLFDFVFKSFAVRFKVLDFSSNSLDSLSALEATTGRLALCSMLHAPCSMFYALCSMLFVPFISKISYLSPHETNLHQSSCHRRTTFNGFLQRFGFYEQPTIFRRSREMHGLV